MVAEGVDVGLRSCSDRVPTFLAIQVFLQKKILNDVVLCYIYILSSAEFNIKQYEQTYYCS